MSAEDVEESGTSTVGAPHPRAELATYDNDPRALRRVYSYFPSGVVALIAEVDGETHGLVASAFTVGVSIDPPLVSCAIQLSSSTWPTVRKADRIGISVLADSHADLARQIGGRERQRRFDGVPLRTTGSAARFVAGAPVWLECSLYAEHPAGDHSIALLEVAALGADPDLSPLVFHGSSFRALHMPEGNIS